jgi:cytochrome c oxidase assembly protein subunit 15
MQKILVTRDQKSIIIWLSICALLVAAMVLVGGYTRLSGSGLSITSWKPIHGVIPPLNDAQWADEFAAYKATPQYELVNKGMTIAEFQTIFWPEFYHRVLGRIIGIVFLFPLLIFAVRSSISKAFFWRLTGIFALGGLQGCIGWIMVKSGLADAPYVNPLKLALHLGTAFALFALILWAILDVKYKETKASSQKPKAYIIFLALLTLQIILGALVAGSHAGLIYNTWPSMNGEFLPAGIFASPLLENLGFIQFLHRTLAIFIAFSFLTWWFISRKLVKENGLNKTCAALYAVILIQFMLGVRTLIMQVPLNLALSHQINALLLWGLAIYLWHRLSCIRS